MKALIVACALVAGGCVTVHRNPCRVVDVPITWTDGSVITWTLTVCEDRSDGRFIKWQLKR